MQRTTKGTGTSPRVRDAVIRILTDARQAAGAGPERRSEHRVPFFRPVLIGLDGEKHPHFSAFTRDLSARGIGLLHIMPLACGEVVVRVPSPSGAPIDLRAYIDRCDDCGEGWYMSGGQLLDVIDPGSVTGCGEE
jgi:hypothetical protein